MSSTNSHATLSSSGDEFAQWQKDLLPHIHAYPATHAASQYHALATNDDIQTFLEQEPLWDNATKQWTSVIQAASIEDLKAGLRDVFDAIIGKLGKKPADGQETREVHLTDGNHLAHLERYPCSGGTSPTIVVRGTGPSFQDPLRSSKNDAAALAFSNSVTFFEVIPEAEMSSDDAHNVQDSALYSRQILIQQPNRRFVRSLLLSEAWCQLFHYDRSGAQYTIPFHIHENVNTFVRLVLGLSSYDEGVLGLDTAVQWTIEGGRKVGGTITVVEVSGTQTKYELCDVEPVFRRWEIQGRGTTGWHVRNSEGVELFIKDCWRPEGDHAEYLILKDVVGEGGVPQLVAVESREVTTAQLRANGDEAWSRDKSSYRVSTRIVMERCGKSIAHFTSQRELVAAIRDAIAAHQALVIKHDVLHRDISQTNILLGGPQARIGDRGKLIDFDMAFRGPRPLGQTPKDLKAGTILFTSVSMLYSRSLLTRPYTPFHDQLDDLESFYYVLYDFMFTWAGVGAPVQEPAAHLQYWASNSPSDCAIYKKGHFLSKPKLGRLSPFWSSATTELLLAFHAIARELVIAKDDVQDLSSARAVRDYEDLLGCADEYYAQVLGIFDKAIDALEKEDMDASPPPSPDDLETNAHHRSSSPASSSRDANGGDPSLPTAIPSTKPTTKDHKDQTGSLSGTSTVAASPKDASGPGGVAEQSKTPASPTAVESPTLSKGCGDPAPQPVTPPRSRNRAVPTDFDDDACSQNKRARSTKPLPVSRKTGWVRTSPHRTRAWVKANPHLT